MSSPATGQGFGKLILFGEHAVVYGQMAVVAGLDRGAQALVQAGPSGQPSRLRLFDSCGVEAPHHSQNPNDTRLGKAFEAMLALFELDAASLEVCLTINLPAGAGLGSSAALAVALSRALACYNGLTEVQAAPRVEAAVERCETIFHGAASGIDQAAALRGGLFGFERLAGAPARLTPLVVPEVRVAICQAGASASTAQMVAAVAALLARERSLVERVNAVIGEIAREALGALEAGHWARLGDLMNINHGALVSLGVSTMELDRACHVARAAGAPGAKLTGGGGGGCVYALVPDGAGDVLEAWQAIGLQGFEVVLGSQAPEVTP
ncbi:MAG: mevalonate kinase [Bradymonadaceae bacterium]|nr:mevalonate kinase [Lujinxingiaceae bacterium]